MATAVSEQEICVNCRHSADARFEWDPGHIGGVMCDCCIKKIWEETLANVTKSLIELKVRCHK